MTRIFIADDHAFVRRGIKQVLEEVGGFEIAGEADNGRRVLNAPDIHTWDVLVLDMALPDVNGPEVLRRLRERRPTLGIVLLSVFSEDQYARRMRAAGANAYLSKSRPPEDLIAAVSAAARGRRYPAEVEGEEEAGAPPPHASLSKRQFQILTLILEGRSVADIAAELDVHSCTVSNHLAKIREKLGVSSVAEMTRYAISAGLLPDAELTRHE